MTINRALAAGAVTMAIAGGALAGALLGVPGVTAAQEGDTTTTTAPADTDAGGGSGFENGADDHGDLRCRPWGRGLHEVGLSAAADALGIGPDELEGALRDGDSVADVAAEEGVDVQDVIEALTAAATAAIDDKVAAGDLEAARAEDIKADLAEHITALVNGEHPGRGHRFGPGGPGS